MTVRTRFAPSPTGKLHIGGARTALFAWLYARKHGGRFVLRIEDTDRERSTAESVNVILEGMAWLGLDYDEGPFFQTRRFDRYRAVIQQLLEGGHAYRCDCTPERLERVRQEQQRRTGKPRYDGHCRFRHDVDPQSSHVIRFASPREGQVVIDDLVKGKVIVQNRELDDLIIARSDGTPTYNLTVVVDDLDMEITHVIRGDDHLNNTPRQINILNALGAPLPRYAHVPMILGEDGKRLSKRHGAVDVLQYREEGYLPEALLNYLVRLGWAYGDQEIFSKDEMIQYFELGDVNRAASTFNPGKLLWLNQHYLNTAAPEHLAPALGWHLGRYGVDPVEGPPLAAVAAVMAPRVKTLAEMARQSLFFYKDFDEYDPKAAKKALRPAALEPLRRLRDALQDLPEPWSEEAVHRVVSDTAERLGSGLGKVAQPLRVAVTGGAASPSIDITLVLIGRARTLARLDRAITYLERQTG